MHEICFREVSRYVLNECSPSSMGCRVVLQAVRDDDTTTAKYEGVVMEILGWFPQYVVGVDEHVDYGSD
jgi:hypothetical protein